MVAAVIAEAVIAEAVIAEAVMVAAVIAAAAMVAAAMVADTSAVVMVGSVATPSKREDGITLGGAIGAEDIGHGRGSPASASFCRY